MTIRRLQNTLLPLRIWLRNRNGLENWTTLLHSIFDGRAKDVYTALTPEQSADYEIVKERILKAYQLVPEAYRLKFRNNQRLSNQTHVEFAREKCNLFDRWLLSKEIGKDFDKLRNLMVLEEFKNCLPTQIKTHLADRGVEKLEAAAIMADDFELVHRQSFVQASQNAYKKWNKNGGNTKQSTEQLKECSKVEQNSCKEQGSNSASSSPKNVRRNNRPVCSFCHKVGHTYESCFKRKRLEKGVALTANIGSGLSKKDSHPSVELSTSRFENLSTTAFKSCHSCVEKDSSYLPFMCRRAEYRSQKMTTRIWFTF